MENKIFEKNGIKYAILNYTYGTNGIPVPYGKEYLVNLWDDTNNYDGYKEKVINDISNLKDKVDVLMVAMHWGREYTFIPTDLEKETAKFLADHDVDIIIGTHPHVIQPVEWIDDTLVIYSLGNFISNQLVIGLNPAIGLMVGVDITVDGDTTKISIKEKELLYSYSDNSTKFKVIPFSKMNDDILPDYKSVEEKYMSIVGDVM